jgi:hypothetical protein
MLTARDGSADNRPDRAADGLGSMSRARSAVAVARGGHHATRAFRLDGTDRGVFAFDGFSEAWFTDRPTFERAHESPAWHALRDDAPNVFAMQALDSGVNMVVDERVIKG